MVSREKTIAASVVTALTKGSDTKSVLERIPGYLNTHWIDFDRVEPEVFASLRAYWQIKDADYVASFSDSQDGDDVLHSLGDMGFSGSTFFATADSAYLVKSVPRHFEYSFFQDDLLQPYAEHMQKNVASLLVRITDFLEPKQSSLGTGLGLAPSHHIVMENIMYGQEDGEQESAEAKWESYDLKPLSYFYPERDVADGAFATDEALSKLADEFKDKLVLSLDDAEEYKAQLEKDTALLARCNAVDYSLFLVRIPAEKEKTRDSKETPLPPAQPPFVPPGSPNWRTGMKSADGKWLYRASVLDFFWAKHKTMAKLMTGLIQTYNVVDKQGPMSITTDSKEYRERFLKMCKDMIEIRD